MILDYNLRNKVIEEGKLLSDGNRGEVIQLSPCLRGWSLQMTVLQPYNKLHSYFVFSDLDINRCLRIRLKAEGITFVKDKESRLYRPTLLEY